MNVLDQLDSIKELGSRAERRRIKKLRAIIRAEYKKYAKLVKKTNKSVKNVEEEKQKTYDHSGAPASRREKDHRNRYSGAGRRRISCVAQEGRQMTSHWNIVEKDNCLLDGASGKALTNFVLHVVRVLRDVEDPGNEPQFAEMDIVICEAADSQRIWLDLRKRGQLKQVMEQCPRAVLIKKGAREILEAHLWSMINSIEQKPTPLFLHQGLNRMGGSNEDFVFIAGDYAINLPEGVSFKIADEAASERLCLNMSQNPVNVVRLICGMVSGEIAAESVKKKKNTAAQNASSVLGPLWDYTILSCFRSEINQLNITTFPVVFLQGPPGTGKTTASERFAAVYGSIEGAHGVLDAGSTEASAIRALSHWRDRVIIADDLARSADPNEEKKRQKLVATLIRFAANKTPITKCVGKSVESSLCQCGVVFTGEWANLSASELERTILIRLKNSLKGGSPTDRVIAATALFHFLAWALPNLRHHLDELNTLLKECDATKNPRLQKTCEMLRWANRSFLKFSIEINAISAEERQLLAIQENDTIRELLNEQLHLSKLKQIPELSRPLSYYVLHAYNNGTLKTVEKKDAIHGENSYKENGSLYIAVAQLLEALQGTPYAFLREKTLGKQLREEGVIQKAKEGRSAAKGKNGARWLQLNLSLLKKKAD